MTLYGLSAKIPKSYLNTNIKKMPRKKPTLHEDNLQIAVSNYIRYQYPHAFFCHIANERQTGIRFNKKGQAFSPKGNKLKQMGVRSGMPDLLIFNPVRDSTSWDTVRYLGLALELKYGKGVPTENQKKCLERLDELGWRTDIAWGFENAKKVIDDYMEGVSK